MAHINNTLENFLSRPFVHGVFCGVSSTVVTAVLPSLVLVNPAITAVFVATMTAASEIYNNLFEKALERMNYTQETHHYTYWGAKIVSVILGIIPANAIFGIFSFGIIPLRIPSIQFFFKILSLWTFSNCGASLLNRIITPVTPANGAVALGD